MLAYSPASAEIIIQERETTISDDAESFNTVMIEGLEVAVPELISESPTVASFKEPPHRSTDLEITTQTSTEVNSTATDVAQLTETGLISSDFVEPAPGKLELLEPAPELVEIQPITADTVEADTATPEPTEDSELVSAKDNFEDGFTVFPIGLNLRGGKTSVTLVEGQESQGNPVAFDQWQIPFDDVVELLNIQVTRLESDEWELRSQTTIVRIIPTDLTTDSDLGLVLSIADVESQLGIPATFDATHYAIQFTPPDPPRQQQQHDAPLSVNNPAPPPGAVG